MNSTGAVGVAKVGAAAEVIANGYERTMATMVSYDDEDVHIGLGAAQGVIRNKKNTCSRIYELLGKKFADPAVQAGLATHCCEVVDKDGMAWFKPEDREAPVDPVELATLLFQQLKKTGATATDGPLEKAVLAVAPEITEDTKAALKAAAAAANVEVEQFILEPVAACLAFDIGQDEPEKDSTVLVYDLGCSSAKLAVVNVRSGIYQLVGSHVDAAVGGEMVDAALFEYLKKEFNKKTKLDVSDNIKATAKLHQAAVACKKLLSVKNAAPVSIESLMDGMDFQCNVVAAKVNLSINKVYKGIAAGVTALLEKCGLTSADITDVVLAGGGANASKVGNTLIGYFGKADILKTGIRPEEVVAIGAAKQSLVLTDLGEESILSELKLKTMQRDICIKAADGSLITVISTGTPIPVARSTTLATSEDNQSSFVVEFVEKEAKAASGGDESPASVSVAKVTLVDLPTQPAGEVKISIRTEISKGGDLRIHVIEQQSGKEVSGVVATVASLTESLDEFTNP